MGADQALGHEIDAELAALDVRLTMGGEPTFVSIDDPDGAEWNTAALGAEKRALATELYHRLRERYAPMGLAHFGQGKWYPGEPLPRWSLNCLLAQGRGACLAQSGAIRRRERRLQRDGADRPAVSGNFRREARTVTRVHHAGL